MIFESHAHYDDQTFDVDREELLKKMPEWGIGRIVNVSASLSGVESTWKLTQQYPFKIGRAHV